MGKLAIGLTSTLAALFFVFGMANLIAGKLNSTECGIQGNPPLVTWNYGTGISYSIIGVLFLISLILILSDVWKPAFIMLILAAPFSIAWTIVGAVSCFTYVDDCIANNYPVWSVSFATILTFILAIPSFFILIPVAIVDM